MGFFKKAAAVAGVGIGLSFAGLVAITGINDYYEAATETTKQIKLPEVNDLSFDASVLKASYRKPIVVYFGGSWCPPCKRLEKEHTHQKLQEMLGTTAQVVYFDVPARGLSKAKAFTTHARNQDDLLGTPAFAVFKDGKRVGIRNMPSILCLVA